MNFNDYPKVDAEFTHGDSDLNWPELYKWKNVFYLGSLGKNRDDTVISSISKDSLDPGIYRVDVCGTPALYYSDKGFIVAIEDPLEIHEDLL